MLYLKGNIHTAVVGWTPPKEHRMEATGLKRRLELKQPSYGVGLLWPSPELVELSGYMGFEWLWLDIEHGPFDLSSLTHVVRAAEASGMDTIARIGHTRDPEAVLRYLETGIAGIIVPHTRTREDVEFAVQATKYPPVGIRSSGQFRPARWAAAGRDPHFYERENRRSVVMALVEDEEGIENLDEILAVDGLDAVVIGYGDLSLTMGYPGEKSHPDVLRVGLEAQRKVLASSKALQVTAQDGAEARDWLDRGALMVRCSLQSILIPAMQGWLTRARAGHPVAGD
jgi:4-hydroxy-2-oxoheptanedioate aldolase